VIGMIDLAAVEAFLAQRRIAVVGVSEEQSNFGRTIHRELHARGYETFAVSPRVGTVDGDHCYPELGAIPGGVDGAIVMVGADRAVQVVESCITLGVPRIWLFKGLGGEGAVSDRAVELCRENGIDVVAGACPMMFLDPVAFPHRAHRALRRLNGSLPQT
jgi:predicted CoA-binding protein